MREKRTKMNRADCEPREDNASPSALASLPADYPKYIFQ
jgi:hypothetical protein